MCEALQYTERYLLNLGTYVAPIMFGTFSSKSDNIFSTNDTTNISGNIHGEIVLKWATTTNGSTSSTPMPIGKPAFLLRT
mmetsp:Transcript_11081/g.19916  ORF Transcript_11081/g.19916 Transcript_11081/m.19916 type:complete len:80 (+) Transcript_11081:129-368(+)